MYKVILIILTFQLSTYAMAQKTRRVVEKRANKQVIEIFEVLKSDEKIRHGEYEMFFNKKSIARGHYENGKRQGHWEFGTESDTVYCHGFYKQGEKDSTWHYYYLNEVASKLEYSKGSIYRVNGFYPDGNQSYVLSLDSTGKGKATSFYKNGNTKEDIPIEDFQVHGIAEAFHANGQLFEKIEFHKGNPVNLLTCQDATGLDQAEPYLKNGTGSYNEYYYNTNNEIILAKTTHYVDSLRDGEYVVFNKKGKIEVAGQHKKGVKSGIWVYYSIVGNTEKNYNENPEEKDSTRLESENFNYSIYATHLTDLRRALFPGGDRALMMFLSRAIQFPKDAIKSEARGICMTSFSVNSTGEIYNGKVLESPHPSLSKAAIYAILSMPNWQPALVFGVPSDMQYTLPVQFTLR